MTPYAIMGMPAWARMFSVIGVFVYSCGTLTGAYEDRPCRRSRIFRESGEKREEKAMQLLGKIMGDPNKRDLKAIQPIIDKINALEPDIKALSDEELAGKTAEFRSKLYLYLRGGMVLEDELVKLFREALQAVEPLAEKCSNPQLHAAIADYRRKIERDDPEDRLKDHLQETLSECFEQGYEKLSPALNALRTTLAMDLAEERQQWPEEAEDPQKATLALLSEVEPALSDIDDEELAE